MSATSKIKFELFKSNKYKILFHSFHARAVVLEYTYTTEKRWCFSWVESKQRSCPNVAPDRSERLAHF